MADKDKAKGEEKAAEEKAASAEAKDSEGGTGEGDNMTPPEAPESEESLDDKTKAELYELAKDADIEGRSSMDKDELADALQREQATEVTSVPSMTDRAQAVMVQGAEFGREERRATIAGNREKRDQQHEALRRTNRPDNA